MGFVEEGIVGDVLMGTFIWGWLRWRLLWWELYLGQLWYDFWSWLLMNFFFCGGVIGMGAQPFGFVFATVSMTFEIECGLHLFRLFSLCVLFSFFFLCCFTDDGTGLTTVVSFSVFFFFFFCWLFSYYCFCCFGCNFYSCFDCFCCCCWFCCWFSCCCYFNGFFLLETWVHPTSGLFWWFPGCRVV